MAVRGLNENVLSVVTAGPSPRRYMSTVALPRRGSPRCCTTTPTSQAGSLPHVVTIDETGFERYAGPVNASWGTGEGLSSGVLDEKEVESGGQVVQAGDVEQGLRVIIHYDDDEEERRLIRKVHEGTCALGQILLGSVFGFMMGATSCLLFCSPHSAYAHCGAITMGLSCGLGVVAASGRFADLPPHGGVVRQVVSTSAPVLAAAILTAGLCLHVLSTLLFGPLLLLLASLSSASASYLMLNRSSCVCPRVWGALGGVLEGQWWMWWHPGKPSSKSPHNALEPAKQRLL